MRMCNQKIFDANQELIPCPNEARKHGFMCHTHVWRNMKRKDMQAPIIQRRPDKMTLLELIEWCKGNVEVINNNCMIYQGTRNAFGYPEVKIWELGKRKTFSVRRLIFEHETDFQLDKSNVVLNKCDRKLCINVDHMYVTDESEKQFKRVMHKMKNKLNITADKVAVIRQSNRTDLNLAERYGVSGSLISKIRNNRNLDRVDIEIFELRQDGMLE